MPEVRCWAAYAQSCPVRDSAEVLQQAGALEFRDAPALGFRDAPALRLTYRRRLVPGGEATEKEHAAAREVSERA